MAQHVFPLEDWIEHHTDDAEGLCPCEPLVEYLDPNTNQPYPGGPLIVHNKLDDQNDAP